MAASDFYSRIWRRDVASVNQIQRRTEIVGIIEEKMCVFRRKTRQMYRLLKPELRPLQFAKSPDSRWH